MKITKSILCCALLSGVFMFAIPKALAQSDDDKKFVANAAQSDRNEIALSEVAVQKATNPAVKAFAQKMVREHKDLVVSG